jgi:hypothetical protein
MEETAVHDKSLAQTRALPSIISLRMLQPKGQSQAKAARTTEPLVALTFRSAHADLKVGATSTFLQRSTIETMEERSWETTML